MKQNKNTWWLTVFSDPSAKEGGALEVGNSAPDNGAGQFDEHDGININQPQKGGEGLADELLDSEITHPQSGASPHERGEADLRFEKSVDGIAASIRRNRIIMGGQYVENRVDGWIAEARALGEKYPGFSLKDAMNNPVFMKMIKLNISVEQAYRAINFDGILREELSRATLGYSDNIKARGIRPTENGITTSGGVAMRSGVNSLSRGQRADIAKRAFNGEKITF